MKLLAVFAIGVIPLLGALAYLEADAYSPISHESHLHRYGADDCTEIEKLSKLAYISMRHSLEDDGESADTIREQFKIATRYAQIYTAFCIRFVK